MKNLALVIATGLIAPFAAAQSAAAQDANLFARDRNVSVDQRGRPELEALGIRAGSFMLYPKVQFDVGHDSDVAVAGVDERSDSLFRVSPRVDIESDWSRHSLTGNIRGATTRYQEYENENTDSFAIQGQGRFDVRRFTAIDGGAEYGREIEPRTSSNSPGSLAEPIRYDIVSSNIGITHTINRVRGSARLDVHDYNYRDGVTFGGVTVEQDDRDQTTYDLTTRVDFALSPATAVYGRVIFNERRFDQAGTVLTPKRDSSGYNAVTGLNFELSNLIRGEVGVGYLKQEYDSPLYGELSGLSANALLQYFATPLLTIGLNADRSVSDSGIVGSAGFLTTTVQGTADYEFRRNILLSGRLGHTTDEFDGIDRENGRWFGSLRGTYLLNRRVGLTAGYDYQSRKSSGVFATNDFTTNRILLSLVLQY